jgi:hypothetical protein
LWHSRRTIDAYTQKSFFNVWPSIQARLAEHRRDTTMPIIISIEGDNSPIDNLFCPTKVVCIKECENSDSFESFEDLFQIPELPSLFILDPKSHNSSQVFLLNLASRMLLSISLTESAPPVMARLVHFPCRFAFENNGIQCSE